MLGTREVSGSSLLWPVSKGIFYTFITPTDGELQPDTGHWHWTQEKNVSFTYSNIKIKIRIVWGLILLARWVNQANPHEIHIMKILVTNSPHLAFHKFAPTLPKGKHQKMSLGSRETNSTRCLLLYKLLLCNKTKQRFSWKCKKEDQDLSFNGKVYLLIHWFGGGSSEF